MQVLQHNMYAGPYVHVRAVRAEGDEMGFDSVGVDASFASALRRVLTAEVPAMAIECAFTKDNTSAYVRMYCMLPEPQTLSSVKCLHVTQKPPPGFEPHLPGKKIGRAPARRRPAARFTRNGSRILPMP